MEYSPLLAFITGILEIGIAVFFIIRIRNKVYDAWIIILILFFLAGYQLLEAFNCSGLFNGSLTRASFIDITWLPPLGILFIMRQNRNKIKMAVSWFYFACALAFTVYYIAFDGSVALRHCEYVMAIYDSAAISSTLYAIYYQSGMALLIILPFIQIPGTESTIRKKNLRDIQLGSLAFTVPSYILALISKLVMDALPSVLCHFALFLAIFLFRILYRISQEKSSS
jgi:hypothetical protein